VVIDNSAQDADPTDRVLTFQNTNRDRCPTIDKMESYVGVSDGNQKVCIPWGSGGGNCDPPSAATSNGYTDDDANHNAS
jgi:hypothetical protein